MKINIPRGAPAPANNVPTQLPARGGGVVIGRLNKVSEMFDKDGNQIDPRTKQIIKPHAVK